MKELLELLKKRKIEYAELSEMTGYSCTHIGLVLNEKYRGSEACRIALKNALLYIAQKNYIQGHKLLCEYRRELEEQISKI